MRQMLFKDFIAVDPALYGEIKKEFGPEFVDDFFMEQTLEWVLRELYAEVVHYTHFKNTQRVAEVSKLHSDLFCHVGGTTWAVNYEV